jgi:hypothetical protein
MSQTDLMLSGWERLALTWIKMTIATSQAAQTGDGTRQAVSAMQGVWEFPQALRLV